MPVLGVPAGCKIHSGVYCVSPSAAGQVVSQMVAGELVSEMDAEVRDIDENAFSRRESYCQNTMVKCAYLLNSLTFKL